MKKLLLFFVFAVILTACAGSEADAAELSDFSLYEAPAFLHTDGSAMVVHEYKDIKYYAEPYGIVNSRVPVRELTAKKLFDENLFIPDELIRMFNRSGGMLHIVNRPFVWGEFIDRTRIEGLCYKVFRNGKTVWDIDVYIATGDHMDPEPETINAASSLAHELGHVLQFRTEHRWTIEDKVELNGIIRQESGLVRQLESSPLDLDISREVFAIIVSRVYGSSIPDPRYKAFVDRIIGYAAEEVM